MIVVTGASGFIGSNVVATLNDQGRDDIVVCDRLGQDLRWQNLRKRTFRDFVPPDQLLGRLPRMKPEAILHFGANSSTTTTDADELMRVNFRFTLDLIDYCAQEGVKLVYASSAATYGDGANGFEDDGSLAAMKKLRPLNLYGWSKHLIDKIVAERREENLPLPPKCIGLKYFNVYGQNEYHKGGMISVVGKNYTRAAAGEPVELFKSHREDYADGEQAARFRLRRRRRRGDALADGERSRVRDFQHRRGRRRLVSSAGRGLVQGCRAEGQYPLRRRCPRRFATDTSIFRVHRCKISRPPATRARSRRSRKGSRDTWTYLGSADPYR